MIAAHRKKESLRVRINATFHFANSAPLQVRRIVVLFIAGDLTTVAADATGHVEVESILLAWVGRSLWDALLRRSRAIPGGSDSVGISAEPAKDSIAFKSPIV